MCQIFSFNTNCPFVLFEVCFVVENYKSLYFLYFSEFYDQESVAMFAHTMRGKLQLIYQGQPFVFEKIVKQGIQEKKVWRCNQWWNEKCRSRVYTVNNIVTPLNRFHTHEDIIKRKKRSKKIKIEIGKIEIDPTESVHQSIE